MIYLKKWGGWLLLLALALFSLWLRLWQSQLTPPGLHFDEAAYGLIANTIRDGDFRVFYREFTGREPIYMYAVALAQLIFGQNVFAERLPAALNGVALIFASFWCFKELTIYDLRFTIYNATPITLPPVTRHPLPDPCHPTPDTRYLTSVTRHPSYWAWLTALMVAFCFWNLHLSREGYRANTPPLFAALAFAACWRATRLQTFKWAIIAGVLSGLTLYTYLSARFVPFVFIGFAGYFLFFYWISWRKLPHFPKLNQAGLRRGAVGIGFFLLTVAPLGLYFAFNRADFFQRTAQISIFSPEGGGAIPRFTANLIEAFKMISFEGTRDMKYNLTGRPVFDPLSAGLFYIGLGICIFRAWRKPVYGFVLVWLFGLFLPTLLSEAGNNPLRSYGAMPAVMGVWALGVVGIWEGLTRLFKRLGWYAGLGLAAVALALTFGFTYNDYFNKWAKSEELYSAFEADYTDLANVLKSRPPERNSVIAAELLDYPSIVYLAPNTTAFAWANIAQALIVPQGVTNLDYIVPKRASGTLKPDWYAPLGKPTIEKIVSPEGRDLGDYYHFKLPENFVQQLPLTTACSSPLNFNDEIVLSGYRLNNTPKVGQPLSLTLYWQANRPSKANYQIFVHLLDTPDSDRKWAQQDANGAYSQGWHSGDIIIGHYELNISPEAKAGEYYLSIGLYDIDDRRQTRALLLTDCPNTNTTKNATIISIKVS